jgi:Na+/glutamate symporter
MTWTLIPVSVIFGFVATLTLRRFSDRAAVRASMNRMIAHLMEFRLFLDTPSLVLRAQFDLLRENLRLLRLILLPCVILAAVFIALLPQLDAIYGHAPGSTARPHLKLRLASASKLPLSTRSTITR